MLNDGELVMCIYFLFVDYVSPPLSFRTRPFLTGLTPLLYTCLKQVHSHPHVVCCTARLLTAMVPLPGIADILCAKSGDSYTCTLYTNSLLSARARVCVLTYFVHICLYTYVRILYIHIRMLYLCIRMCVQYL